MRTRMDGVHHKHRTISSGYLYETDARLYIKQRSQSSVLVKQAKKNSFKMLSSICSPDLFCPCANKLIALRYSFDEKMYATATPIKTLLAVVKYFSFYFIEKGIHPEQNVQSQVETTTGNKKK